MPLANPFALTPPQDYVRDAAALFCLLATLGMPWTGLDDGSELWWVALPLVLALLSVATPYVMASRVIATITPSQSQLIKAAACAPLLVAIVVTVILELVTIGQELFESTAGVGAGVAMALAGLGLVVQPRATEEVLGLRGEQGWVKAAAVSAFAAVGLGVVMFFVFFVMAVIGSYGVLYANGDGPLFWIIAGVAVAVPPVLLAGLPAAGMASGNAAARRALAVVAWTVVAVGLFGLADGPFVSWQLETWRGPTGGLFVLGLAAALSVSRPAQRATNPLGGASGAGSWAAEEAAEQWGMTARTMLGLAAAGLGVLALGVVVAAVAGEEFSAVVVTLMLTLVAGAVACGAGASLAGDMVANRTALLSSAGLAVVLAIVSAVLADRVSVDTYMFEGGINGWDAAVLFVLPIAAIVVVLAPRVVRSMTPSGPREAWTNDQ